MIRSQARWIWLKRTSAAVGAMGLKVQSGGAVTVTGRKLPSFCGMCSGRV